MFDILFSITFHYLYNNILYSDWHFVRVKKAPSIPKRVGRSLSTKYFGELVCRVYGRSDNMPQRPLLDKLWFAVSTVATLIFFFSFSLNILNMFQLHYLELVDDVDACWHIIWCNVIVQLTLKGMLTEIMLTKRAYYQKTILRQQS